MDPNDREQETDNDPSRGQSTIVSQTAVVRILQTICTRELEDTLYYLVNAFNEEQYKYQMVILTNDSDSLLKKHGIQAQPGNILIIAAHYTTIDFIDIENSSSQNEAKQLISSLQFGVKQCAKFFDNFVKAYWTRAWEDNFEGDEHLYTQFQDALLQTLKAIDKQESI